MAMTLKEQLTGKCRHFTSLIEGLRDKAVKCDAGISYYELCKIDELGHTCCALRHPCGWRKMGSTHDGQLIQTCNKYEPLTEEEIQQEVDEMNRVMECIEKGISSCCGSPIDESHVIKEGQYKNHGSRFCGKCKKLVYMV